MYFRPGPLPSDDRRLHLLISCAALLILGIASPVVAGPITYNIFKTVTWESTPSLGGEGGGLDLLGAVEGRPAPPDPPPPILGRWRFAQHVLAERLRQVDHADNVPLSDDLVGLNLPAREHAAPNQFRWSPSEDFNQRVPLPVQSQGPLTRIQGTVKAESLVELSTTVDVQQNEIAAIIHVQGLVDIGVAEESKHGESVGAGEIHIQGTQLRVDVRNGDGALLKVNPKKKVGEITGVSTGFVPGSRQNGSFLDPLAIDIFDAVTGDFIAGQQIYTEAWRIAGAAQVAMTDEGLLLSAGAGGSAAVEMATLGTWVLNPFAGRAILRDGALTLSGALAALPWQSDTSSEIVTAFLPAAALDLLFPLQVLPKGLGEPEHDLRYILSTPAQAVAVEAVPEPASLLLLGAALAAGCARWKRRQ